MAKTGRITVHIETNAAEVEARLQRINMLLRVQGDLLKRQAELAVDAAASIAPRYRTY